MKIERVFLFSAIVLVAFSAIALFRGGALWWDETVYLGLADNLHTKHEFVFNINNDEEFRAPMLPAMIAGAYYVLGQSVASAKVVIFLSMLSLVFAVYFLGKKLYGEKTGTLGALLIASMSEVVFWSSKVLTEVPALLFATVSLYLSYEIIEEKKTKLYPLLGAAFAAAVLTRYPLILLPAFFALWGALRGEWRTTFFSKQAALGALVFTIMLIPWMYNSYTTYGSVFGSLSYNTYIVNDLHGGKWYQYAVDFLPTYGVLGGLFLISSVYLLARKKDRRNGFLLSWFVLAILALSFGIGEKQIRYLFIAAQAVALISARAITEFSAAGKNRQTFSLVLIAVVVLAGFTPAFQKAYTNKGIGLIIEDAGTYLKNNAPGGTLIMSQDIPPFVYYSKHYVIWFPKDEWAVMDFVHRYNVSYVEIDNYVWYPDYALNYFDDNKYFSLEYNKTEGDKFIRIYRYTNA